MKKNHLSDEKQYLASSKVKDFQFFRVSGPNDMFINVSCHPFLFTNLLIGWLMMIKVICTEFSTILYITMGCILSSSSINTVIVSSMENVRTLSHSGIKRGSFIRNQTLFKIYIKNRLFLTLALLSENV